MDVEGEGHDPGRAHLMRLAASNRPDPAWAAAAIDRVATVAGGFRTACKEHAIRPPTRQTMARATKTNRARMV